jgi:iron complex outermembrane recepter protein
MRGVSSGVYDNNWIVCTTACPISTANNITTDLNHMKGDVYFDLNTRYDIEFESGKKIELFFNVKNLFDTDPAPFYPGPNGNAWQIYPAVPANYDILGRVFRAGIRIQM